jgi:uncharacterized protein YebE (UPF0316 family)
MTHTGRRFLAAAATVVATLAILVTLLANYANHILVKSAGFSGRAVNVVQTPAVESLIVGIVTDRLAADAGNESSLRPVIEDAVREVLSNGQITGQIRAAATSLQSELVSGTATRLTLALSGLGSSIASQIQSESPELAAEVRDLSTITVLDVPIPATDARVIHDLASVARDSSLLLVLSAALIALALLLSPRRVRTLRGLGLGALLSGLFAVAVYLVGRGLVLDEFSAMAARTAAGAAWSTYLGGLETWGFVLAGIGAVMTFATTLL